jgi:hypothetical protein
MRGSLFAFQSKKIQARGSLRFQSHARYSGFDSALYKNVDAKGHFSQPGPRRQVFVAGVEENATSHDLQIATLESKPL